MGITFKENCPDIRNSKVIDVVHALKEYGAKVTVYDPWADPEEVAAVYQLSSTQQPPQETFDAIVLTVAHQEFTTLNISQFKKEKAVVYDVKSVLPKEHVDKSL